MASFLNSISETQESQGWDTNPRLSVESIAQRLFSIKPEHACRYNLLKSEIDQFEILITLLMEGLSIRIGGLGEINLNDVPEDSLQNSLVELAPWIESVGYGLCIDSFLLENQLQSQFRDRYCKILIKGVHEHRSYFEHNNIEKNYTFLLNPLEIDRKNLLDYYAIFILDDIVYRIQFTELSSI